MLLGKTLVILSDAGSLVVVFSYFLPMLYSSRKVPGTSTFTSWPVPKRELSEELLLLELLKLCCWSRSCCCLLCSSSLSCSCLCCSILSFSNLICSCLCCSILSCSSLICSCLCCSILSFSSLTCSRLSSWILICSSLCCSARAAAWAYWALKASETRVTILGWRMFKILVTRADLEEEDEDEDEELKLDELDPVEENFDPEEKELCC